MSIKSNIINGRYLADKILANLSIKISKLKSEYNIVPGLAIILVGDNAASSLYVKNKLKAAQNIHLNAFVIKLPKEITTLKLVDEINKLNNNADVSGIIVQLPLPAHIDKNAILLSIDPKKDVDGFHPINVGYLHSGIQQGFVPCTARGCLELLKSCAGPLEGKNVVIVGRSNIVGRPLAALLLNNNCTVTICHSKTKNLPEITRGGDIIVAAIGSPLMLKEEYFKQDAIIIDVGINRDANSPGVVGDVDFANVQNKAKFISPVPGGVGPMTIAFLLANTVSAATSQHHLVEFINE